jgi:hypothetical protein
MQNFVERKRICIKFTLHLFLLSLLFVFLRGRQLSSQKIQYATKIYLLLAKFTAIQVRRIIEITGFIVGAFAILTQFGYILSRVEIKGLTYLGEVTRFWSYMTIWTNTLVIFIWAAVVFDLRFQPFIFLRLHSVRTAAAMYILFVGVVYHLLLSKIATFSSTLAMVNDFVFHTFIPILFVAYWLFVLPKTHVEPKKALSFMLYPFFYGVYTFTRGFFTDLYPYPFFDVTKLGYPAVFLNGLGFMLFYGFIGLLLISLNNRWAEREARITWRENH